MSEFEGFGEQGNAPIVSEAERKGLTREQAVEIGRQLGEQTADARGETGADREQRIARAKAYAAWDYDGRPASSKLQREEFGVGETSVLPSLERPRMKVVGR